MNRERLEKLADHLESGELGHDQFNMRCWSMGPRKPNGCGTCGCAAGELPLIFPGWWEFAEFDVDSWAPVCVVLGEDRSIFGSLEYFFEISPFESNMLFGFRWSDAPWNPYYPKGPSRFDVARDIRKFVAWKELGG